MIRCVFVNTFQRYMGDLYQLVNFKELTLHFYASRTHAQNTKDSEEIGIGTDVATISSQKLK